MFRWTVPFAVVLLGLLMSMGCSSGGQNPAEPTALPDTTSGVEHQGQVQTHLWGYYDFYIDTQAQTIEVVLNHSAMFAANVVSFLNNNPAGVSVSNLVTTPGLGYMDVAVDVSLTHPLNLEAYNGYDVRGIFIGNGSETLKYQGLDYSGDGTDQMLYNADGYSRWYNAMEFLTPGVLGYTQGKIASAGYKGNATLNPYKYFADGLSANEDLWDFLTGTGHAGNGVFSNGMKNTRHYELRFPTPVPNVKFGYSVVANWKGELPEDHPANATEALVLNTEIEPDIYYVDPTHKGGDLILDLGIFDWGSVVNSGVMDDYGVIIEGEVFVSNYTFTTSDLTATGGDSNYSTYHVEIPTDNVTYNSNGAGHDSEFWVIVEYPDANYKNEYGVTNGAGNDPLAAFFRIPLYIHNVAYNIPPTIDSGVTGDETPFGYAVSTYSVVAHDDDGDPLTYSWTVSFAGTPLPDYDGVPGDGAGNLDIDFAPLEPEDGDEFYIECIVSDGSDETPATPLTVNASTILYYWYGVDDGNGNMTIMPGGQGPTWTWVSASNVWDENGNINNMYGYYSCTTLETPAFEVPAGNYMARLELTVSGDIPSDPYGWGYGIASGLVGYSKDGGTNWTWNSPAGSSCGTPTQWLTNSTGTDFNWDTCQYNLGLYGLQCMDCDYYGYYGIWEKKAYGRGTIAPIGSPVTGNWKCQNGIKGNTDVKLGFNFNQGMMTWGGNGNGWQIHKIKVYAAPPPPPPPPEEYVCEEESGTSYDSAYELTSGYNSMQYVDDGGTYINLPFTFSFAGQNYTYAYIEHNGGLSFNNYAGWYYTGCPPGYQGWDWIWPVETDLDSYCWGQIRWGSKTVNSKDCFIIQWYDYAHYYCSGHNNFMIVLVNSTQTVYDPWMVQYGTLDTIAGYEGSFNYQPGGTPTSCCITSSIAQNKQYKKGLWN